MITLTVAEIKDLAECAGIDLVKDIIYDADELETEIVVIECPKNGVRDDDGNPKHYSHIAYFEACPEEGSYPLGDEIDKSADNCSKCGNPWIEHEFAVPAPYCP